MVSGVMGVLQAAEALELLGIGEPLFGRLLADERPRRVVRSPCLRRDPGCLTCSSSAA
jgi:hypothetical protein